MNIVGIIGAMPSELADIRKTLGTAEIIRKSGFEFYVNQVNGKKLINVCCGIAKVNAALCTQVLIDNFHPECVINTGIAGGMNSDVKVCDIVISTEVLAHDLDLHFLNDYPPYCGIFRADERLISKTEEICRKEDIRTFRGRIVSGESFISSNEAKKSIQEKFNPYAVDMETSAIGHCCYLNEMPFVSIRCISDNADDEGAMSFDRFEKIAAERVAKIILKVADEI